MKNKKLKTVFIIFFIAGWMSLFSNSSTAQCAMCRANVESNLKDGTGLQMALGLNAGILYLLSIPYVIGGIGYFIWRKNKNGN